MMQRLGLVAAVLVGFSQAQNLLVNGDFEQNIAVGWTQGQGGYGSHTINRQTGLHPDPDYEGYVQQYDGGGYTKLYQIVDVAGPDLTLSFWAKWALGGGSSSCWPVAALCVEYYNQSGMFLGDTRFYYHDAYCNWSPSTTRSLIDIVNPDWMLYTLDIDDELQYNLPGINSHDVAKIGIQLYCYTSSS